MMTRAGWLLGLIALPWAALAQESLTARFEDDLATQEWSLVKTGVFPSWQPSGVATAFPLRLTLIDYAQSRQAELLPSAYFVTEDRQRWGGRTLGVDWVLVLDGATADLLRVSGQLQAGQARLLGLDIRLTAPADGRPPVQVQSDPGAPRLHHALDESSEPGIHYDLALDPEAQHEPGRTTFRFAMPGSSPTGVPIWAASSEPADDTELRAAIALLVKAQARGQALQVALPHADPAGQRPVFADLVRSHITTLETSASLEVALHNHQARPLDVRLSLNGTSVTSLTTVTLQAGESRIVHLGVEALDRSTVAGSVDVEADGQSCLRAPVRVDFLAPDASLARDTRVLVEVDSTLSGYSAAALFDGRTEDTTSPDCAWASDETESAHWVRITFPQPTEISELRLFWPRERERAYVSQLGEATGWTADGIKLPLASIQLEDTGLPSVIHFDPVQVKSVEWRQPRGSGSPDRPNLLWLNELEVR